MTALEIHDIRSTRPGDRRSVYNALLLDETNDSLAESIGRALLLSGRFQVHCLTESIGRLRLHRATTTVADLSSGSALLRSVEQYVADHAIDVVLPVQESMIARVAEVGDALSSLASTAPIPSAELLHRMHDKWRCRQLFIAAGLDVPLAWPLSASGRADVAAFDRPVLLKPVLGRGGQGIQRFDSGGDLVAALDSSPIDLDQDTESWMAEELVAGADVGVCLLALDGEVVGAASRRNVVGQSLPHRSAGVLLDYYSDDALQELGRTFAAATGWSGPADIDCRLTDDGRIKALEVNPRFWQTMLGPVSLGSNYPAAACLLAVGEDVPPMRPPTGSWLNVEALIHDWRNVRGLVPEIRRALSGVHLEPLLVDPRYELDLIKLQTSRQAKTRVKRALDRLGTRVGTRQNRVDSPNPARAVDAGVPSEVDDRGFDVDR